MFTGLIEEIGIVKRIKKNTKSFQMIIQANKVLENIKIGDSISTNGVCLTVTEFDSNSFTVDVMPETLRRSNLKKSRRVNLERALKVGDRLGGHFVSGHIDDVGIIKSFKNEGNAVWVTIEPNHEILKYIIQKGSIAIDGISLTVAYVDDKRFKVSIIPLTKDETTLLNKKVGDKVNLECDMVGKYIEKFTRLEDKEKVKDSIDINFLKQNGFV